MNLLGPYLLHGIEDPRLPRVVPNAGIVLPVSPVAAQVVIAQHGLVPLGPYAPIDAQVLRQKGRHVLPEPVARVPSQKKLPHARIDEACPCRALQKTSDLALQLFVPVWILPGNRTVGLEAFNTEQAGAELARGEPEVVAPEQFESDSGRALVLAFPVAMDALAKFSRAVFELEQVFMDLSGGDAPKSKPSREFRAEIETQHPVASVFVRCHASALDQVSDSVMALRFTTVKRVGRLGVLRPLKRLRKIRRLFQRLIEAENDLFESVWDSKGSRLRWN